MAPLKVLRPCSLVPPPFLVDYPHIIPSFAMLLRRPLKGVAALNAFRKASASASPSASACMWIASASRSIHVPVFAMAATHMGGRSVLNSPRNKHTNKICPLQVREVHGPNPLPPRPEIIHDMVSFHCHPPLETVVTRVLGAFQSHSQQTFTGCEESKHGREGCLGQSIPAFRKFNNNFFLFLLVAF